MIVIHEHTIVLEGLRLLLEQCTNFEIVGEGRSCDEALEMLASKSADVALVDNDLLDAKCMGSVSTVIESSPEIRVIIMTGIRDAERHREAIQHGAAGLFLKDQNFDVLVKAIHKVAQGEVWLDRSMVATVLAELRRNAADGREERSKIDSLTVREREIVSLVCEGLRNQEIADRLFIGEKTVRNHLASIFSKLHVAHRLELSVYARKQGLAAHND